MTDPPARPDDGSDVAVFATQPEAPEEGRIFLWCDTMWYELVVGDSDAIAFEPVASTQEELDALLADGEERELWELDDEFAEDLARSFRSLEPLLEADIEGFEEDNHEEPEDELASGFRMHGEVRRRRKPAG